MMNEVDAEKIGISIELIKQYINDSSVDPVIVLLESLQQDPSNEALRKQLAKTLKGLGIIQGAVLTYAPYVAILVSIDLFEDM